MHAWRGELVLSWPWNKALCPFPSTISWGSVILNHGVVTPGRQAGELLLSGCSDGPAPGLKESSQVHPHSLGESHSVQVHLSRVVLWKVAHLVVGGKHLLIGVPAKLILELRQGRQREMWKIILITSKLALNRKKSQVKKSSSVAFEGVQFC